MPRKDKQHRIILPKRVKKVTIEDLLTNDDINGMFQELEKVKPNISDLIIIYVDKKTGDYQYLITDNTLVSLATYLLECTKLDILSHGEDE